MNSQTTQALKELSEIGYTVLKGVLDPAECKKMAAHLDQMEVERKKANHAFVDEQRVILWDVHQTDPDMFLNKVNLPPIMEVVQAVMKETVILGSFGGIRNQMEHESNNVHIDSRVPMQDFKYTFQMIAMMCITDFTKENGSTYFWPFSHRTGMSPKDVYPPGTPLPGKVQLEGKAGDVILFLGQTWHDVGRNISGEKRWGLLAYYQRWWVKPSFDYTKCGPEIFARLTPEQKVLFGFNTIPPKDGRGRLNTVMNTKDIPADYKKALEI
jgi:ectoine hydroxylase-related dioxygenase (phytanoyl-CoA dioxygenase family)